MGTTKMFLNMVLKSLFVAIGSFQQNGAECEENQEQTDCKETVCDYMVNANCSFKNFGEAQREAIAI